MFLRYHSFTYLVTNAVAAVFGNRWIREQVLEFSSLSRFYAASEEVVQPVESTSVGKLGVHHHKKSVLFAFVGERVRV